jgi:phage shock protein E
MKLWILGVLLGIFVAGSTYLSADTLPDEAIQQMLLLPSRVIIDVRTKTEYQEGHLEEALLIPFDQIENRISKSVPSKETPILVYCRSGNRATIAKESLEKLGYAQVYNLGGYEDVKKVYVNPAPKTGISPTKKRLKKS